MQASEHHIPAIFHMEGLTGAQIVGATIFPSGIARASSFDTALEKAIGEIVAREEIACGITHTFAPVLDVSRDSRMGRQAETYGEDPALVSALGVAYAQGIRDAELNGRRTESVAKHFLGFHNSCGGIHGANSDTPPRLLREIYARPFQAAIRDAGLRGIMPCYCSVDGEQPTASRKILTELLREDMGFDGVCVSDYSAVEQLHSVRKVAETFTEAGLLALSAGMDIEQPRSVSYNEELMTMFADGRADIRLLDQAVLRVLEAKFRMGLFEQPFAYSEQVLSEVYHVPSSDEASLRSARESIILLKNNGALPIRRSMKKILVVGPQAKNARFYFGGYTIVSMLESKLAARQSMAGVQTGGGSNSESGYPCIPGTYIQTDEDEKFDSALTRVAPGCQTLLDVLHEKLPDTEIVWAKGYPIAGEDSSGFEDALSLAVDADAILLTLGGKYGTGSIATMGEGIDATNINLPPCQDAFILRAKSLGKPLIGIHIDGRPISSNTADACLDAILETWTLGANAAQAICDVLCGDANPSGKLPLSVAYNAGQIPIYYNHPNGSAWHQAESIGFLDYADCPHTPRYPFGYGLSYTCFAYSDLSLSAEEVEPDGQLQVSFTVENTGGREGTEIVQLYLSDCYASLARPVKELAGFGRVSLKPGEKKRVRFTFSPSQLAFLDAEMRWKIEKGTVTLEIGASSADVRLSSSFAVSRDRWIAGHDRSFYADFFVE